MKEWGKVTAYYAAQAMRELVMQSRYYLRWGLILLGSSILTLWVLDVAVSLSLLRELLVEEPAPATLSDHLGLMIGDAQLALACVVFSCVGAIVIRGIVRKADVAKQSVILLSAVMSGLVVIVATRVEWGFSSEKMRLSLAIGAVVGFCLWILLLWITRRRSDWPLGFADAFGFMIGCALIVGFGNETLADLFQEKTAWSVIGGGITLLLITAAWLASRRRGTRLARALPWIPVFVALYLAGHSLFAVPSRIKVDGVSNNGLEARPNIILIVLDTARADRLKPYGYARDTMPSLTRWAEEALVVKRAVSPAGWTTAAHASIFSGRPVSLHGVHYRSREDIFCAEAYPDIPWLPGQLAENGYTCLAVTANPLAIPAPNMGFHRIISPDRSDWLNGNMGALADRVLPFFQSVSERLRWRMPYLVAGGVTDAVVKAVPEGDGPLFLFVNFFDAHAPYNPPVSALEELGVDPPPLMNRYLGDLVYARKWSSLPETKTQYLTDLYDGELRGLDTALDELLTWIDDRYGRDTVVIVTSDHGEELGEEGRVGHEYGVLQSLVHVPLFIRSPGLPVGELEEEVTTRNLYNFVLRLGRGEVPGVEALTFVDRFGVISERYLSGRSVKQRGADHERAWVAIIKDGYKAVGPTEYGFELLDLADFDQPVWIAESWDRESLQKWIDDYWDEYEDRRKFADDVKGLTEEQLKKLRALGYID